MKRKNNYKYNLPLISPRDYYFDISFAFNLSLVVTEITILYYSYHSCKKIFTVGRILVVFGLYILALKRIMEFTKMKRNYTCLEETFNSLGKGEQKPVLNCDSLCGLFYFFVLLKSSKYLKFYKYFS